MPLRSFFREKRRLLFAVALIVVCILTGGGIFLSLHWPFSKERVKESLQRALHGTVQISKLQSTFFPHPGCRAEGIRLWRGTPAGNAPPIATAQSLTIQARYSDFLLRPGYIERIVIDGVRIEIPARKPNSDAGVTEGKNAGASQHGKADPPATNAKKGQSDKGHTTRVGEIVTKSALVEIERQGGKPPLKFAIHSLVLHSVSEDKPFAYDLAMRNAEPPGEVKSQGIFGPWNQKSGAQTPLSGAYSFEHADLSVFRGIAGMLSSHGHFAGELSRIQANGTIHVAGFMLTAKNHAIATKAMFQAVVDARKGDVLLPAVTASFLQTTVVAHGEIAGEPGERGKTTSLDLTVDNGRIENLLFFFTKGVPPPLDGPVVIHAHATVPAKGLPFLKELAMEGNFRITDGHFAKPGTQSKIDKLSARTSGHGKNEPADVAADLQGYVSVRGGTATFERLSFSVPGAVAQMTGTYNLLNTGIDLTGKLKTKADISHMTHGIKSVLLTPLDPFFSKGNAGAVIPITMTGTYSDHSFSAKLP